MAQGKAPVPKADGLCSISAIHMIEEKIDSQHTSSELTLTTQNKFINI